jgi:hypothetical protein
MTKLTDEQWSAIWAAWIAYFVAAERAALKSGNPRAPLSHFLRRALGTHTKPLHRYAGQVAFGAGVVWLIDHLWQGVKES